MKRVGQFVQYIDEDGQPKNALVAVDIDEDRKDIVLCRNPGDMIRWRMDIPQGHEPGHWRPIL